MAKNKKTKIKGGYFHNGKGKQFTVLQDALANDTKCGCGINCKDGFVSLPSFDSVSGDKEGFHGFYFVDGELVTDTVPNIKEEIKSFCNGPQEPQALRLTFDSIENANTLVGDASNVSDWNTFFDLPTYGTPFSAVTISGNTVQLFGGSDIETKFQLFSDNQHLLEIWDYANCIITLGDETFGGTDGNSVLTTAHFPAVTTTLVTNSSTYGVFGLCNSLTYVYLPNCVNLAGTTFYYCTALTTEGLTLPFSSITSLGFYTFQYCLQLTELSFPNVTNIGDYCFDECTSLTTIDLPSLTTAGDFCFSYCNSLTTVNLPNLITAGGFCFRSCPLTTIDLPSLTTVGDSFFEDCTSLTAVNIPYCTNLGGTIGDDNVFNGISGNTITLTVPSALMTADSGNPDGDIAYLQANNTVTVITV